MSKALKELQQQITKALEDIDELGTFSGAKEPFNFFHATGCAGYELRHAAFFSWLFDSRKHDRAGHFVLHFLRRVADDVGDVVLAQAVKGLQEKTAHKNIEIQPLKGFASLTELSIEEKKRIDFAADVTVRGSQKIRLVIEFKLRGDLSNDLAAYRRAATATGPAHEVYLVIDFSGRAHEELPASFAQADVAVLLDAVQAHLELLDTLSERYWPLYYATRDYLKVLREHAGLEHTFSPRDKEALWNLWSPEMEAPELTGNLDAFSAAETERLLPDEEADEAYIHRWWQLLATRQLHTWVAQRKRVKAKLVNGYWMHLHMPIRRQFPDLRFALSLQSAYWLPRTQFADVSRSGHQFFVRLTLRAYQPRDGEEKKAAEHKAVLASLTQHITSALASPEAGEVLDANGATPLSTALFVVSDAGVQPLAPNRRTKRMKHDMTIGFLIPISTADLYAIAVVGDALSVGDRPNAWMKALKLLDLVADFRAKANKRRRKNVGGAHPAAS